MAIYNARPGGGSSSGYALVSLVSNKNSISLTSQSSTDTFTITYSGDGTLTVTSSDTSVATVALVSGKTYRVTAANNTIGDAVITVKASVGAHTIPVNQAEIDVSVNTLNVSNTLNDNSWNTISLISQRGLASNYWDIGDCKQITLNGTVGTLSLSNLSLYVYIIGFDHNSEIEGTGISFGTFKNALTNGDDVFLCDTVYGQQSSNGSKFFNINHWGVSSSLSPAENYWSVGGWGGCDLRYDILGSTNTQPTGYGQAITDSRKGGNATTAFPGGEAPSTTATNPVSNTLMAALPSDLRAVMKPIVKYSDNTGLYNSDYTTPTSTATKDYLPLMSVYEIMGVTTAYLYPQYSFNSGDNYNQLQYKYYENGNSVIKHKHTTIDSNCMYWTRSTDYGEGVWWGMITTSDIGSEYPRYSAGIAPVFLV